MLTYLLANENKNIKREIGSNESETEREIETKK